MRVLNMKTSELTGAALDWAVAKCEGIVKTYIHKGYCKQWLDFCGTEEFLLYSTYWAQGGPIIEREGITLRNYIMGDQWDAEIDLCEGDFMCQLCSGPT